MRILDPKKALAWVVQTYQIQTREEAVERISDIDQIDCTVTIDGETVRPPDNCLIDLFDDSLFPSREDL